eukprot:SAG31_NODE_3542_length_4143_cov_2.092977_4_plen_118_part_00
MQVTRSVDGEVLGSLDAGEAFIVIDISTRVINGEATSHVRVTPTAVESELADGWFQFQVEQLEHYLPSGTLPAMPTPGFPHVSFDLLWQTLVKIGFPILEVTPRSRAIDMVAAVFAR